jgi:hypothetical protein
VAATIQVSVVLINANNLLVFITTFYLLNKACPKRCEPYLFAILTGVTD